MEKLDLADFETGAKVAGFRGYFLKGDGARLQFALWRFVEDFFFEFEIAIDNIFADIGVDNPEEELIKAELAWKNKKER
jgi:hypothetical protein